MRLYLGIGLEGQRFDPETFSTRRTSASDSTAMLEEKNGQTSGKKVTRNETANLKKGQMEGERERERENKAR